MNKSASKIVFQKANIAISVWIQTAPALKWSSKMKLKKKKKKKISQ